MNEYEIDYEKLNEVELYITINPEDVETQWEISDENYWTE